MQVITEGGVTTITYDSGHVVEYPEQPVIVKEPDPVYDVETITEPEFRKLVLRKLGYKVVEK